MRYTPTRYRHYDVDEKIGFFRRTLDKLKYLVGKLKDVSNKFFRRTKIGKIVRYLLRAISSFYYSKTVIDLHFAMKDTMNALDRFIMANGFGYSLKAFAGMESFDTEEQKRGAIKFVNQILKIIIATLAEAVSTQL